MNYACRICAHEMKPAGEHAHACEHCGTKESHRKPKSARATLTFAATALIFYVPAMLFPFMTVELYGNRTKSTIWGGTIALCEDGSYAIALVVFLASILIPFLKILILFFLGLSAGRFRHRHFQMKLYHIVEAIGRWSMLDIFLLAILVAMLKLGHWTSVKAEVGSSLFLLVVIFTMLSSALFDPQLIWKDSDAHVPKVSE